jgi:hypothetical protein
MLFKKKSQIDVSKPKKKHLQQCRPFRITKVATLTFAHTSPLAKVKRRIACLLVRTLPLAAALLLRQRFHTDATLAVVRAAHKHARVKAATA